MKRVIVVSAIAACALLVSACGSTQVASVARSTSSAFMATDMNGQTCLPTQIDKTTNLCPGDSSPSPSPSPSLTTESLGDGFEITSNGTVYDVTLDKVTQYATASQYENVQNPGDHFAAVQFTITGVTGTSSDDANSDASVIGSDGQEYSFAAAVLTVPNFNSGLFNVSAGITVKGWVAFELPPGVTITQVQWSPGISTGAGTWNAN